MDLYYLIALLLWAAGDYFIADMVVKKNEGFKANPILYALGAFTLGGIYPLLFLGCKFIWFKYKQNDKKEQDEVEALRKRLEELENKNNE